MIARSFINTLTVVYILTIVALLLAAEYLLPGVVGSTFSNDSDFELKDHVSEQLKLTLDLISRRIGLASALIAAALWLMSRPLTDEREARERLACCAVALASAIASLIFGYKTYENILVLIGSGRFDAFADAIDYPQTFQYWGFIISGACIGLSAIRSANAIYRREDT